MKQKKDNEGERVREIEIHNFISHSALPEIQLQTRTKGHNFKDTHLKNFVFFILFRIEISINCQKVSYFRYLEI